MVKQQLEIVVAIILLFFSSLVSSAESNPVGNDAGPNITINFAGNLSDKGGPYWRPPGETDILDEGGEGIWRDGYYTTYSKQQEDWIYINVTVSDDDGVDHVWLQWLNGTQWTNWSYRFVHTIDDYWELNTSGHIVTCEGYQYSFDIVVNDTLGNSQTMPWTKIGLGGKSVRRYIQLHCMPTDIAYRPWYFYVNTDETGTYGSSDLKKGDRLHHDQGPDGSLGDTGYLLSTLPGGKVELRWCSTFVSYWFDGSICCKPFTLENIYYHFWWSTKNNHVGFVGWDKTRSYPVYTYPPYINSYSTSSSQARSHIYYNSGNGNLNNNYFLDTHLLHVNPTIFTDNNIYECYVGLTENAWPSCIGSRECLSFVIFNMPGDEILEHMDSDHDDLNDYDELFVYYTSPFLADTDNDGATDYEEVNGASHGYWNSDPNSFMSTTDYRRITVDAHGPYSGYQGEEIQFTGDAAGGIPPYTWCWDFGDTHRSYEQNPKHVYNETGEYIVTLTVTDSKGNRYNDSTTAAIRVPRVHNIDKNISYWYIQDAIGDADPGNTLQVKRGIYVEHIVVNKPLTIIGEEKETTIIDGNKTGSAVKIIANDVQLSGFTIQNSGRDGNWDVTSGVYISSSFNTIKGNTITNNRCGIYQQSSNSTAIIENMIIANYWGMYLTSVSSDSIAKNDIADNDDIGLSMDYSQYNKIIGNTITHNGYGSTSYRDGIYLGFYNKKNSIYHNNFIANYKNAIDKWTNIWNNSYPPGGNYWSDHDNRYDDYQGSFQNIPGADGIVDNGIPGGHGLKPYIIPGKNPPNRDWYPLQHLFVIGDMNVDGKVNFKDINPFVQAISKPGQYMEQYKIHPVIHGDINQDGYCDFGDINPFVQLLTGG